jgi:hypothetical protein
MPVEVEAGATLGSAVSAPVGSTHVFRLARAATHVALYWRGPATARVRLQLSRDERSFGRWRRVTLDEVGRRIGTRAWTVRADVPQSTFNDTGLKAETTYRYRVSAYDRTGNTSPPSVEVSAAALR